MMFKAYPAPSFIDGFAYEGEAFNLDTNLRGVQTDWLDLTHDGINYLNLNMTGQNTLVYAGRKWRSNFNATTGFLYGYDLITGQWVTRKLITPTGSFDRQGQHSWLVGVNNRVYVIAPSGIRLVVLKYDVDTDTASELFYSGTQFSGSTYTVTRPYKLPDGKIALYHITASTTTSVLVEITLDPNTEAVTTRTVYSRVGSGGTIAGGGSFVSAIDYSVDPPVLHALLHTSYINSKRYIKYELGAASPYFDVDSQPNLTTAFKAATFLYTQKSYTNHAIAHDGVLYVLRSPNNVSGQNPIEVHVCPVDSLGNLEAPVKVLKVPTAPLIPTYAEGVTRTLGYVQSFVHPDSSPVEFSSFVRTVHLSTEVGGDYRFGFNTKWHHFVYTATTPTVLASGNLSTSTTFIAEIRRLGEAHLQSVSEFQGTPRSRFGLSLAISAKTRVIAYLPTKAPIALFPNILVGRARPNEWIYHSKLRIPFTNRANTIHMDSCPRSGGGFYALIATNGDANTGSIPTLLESPCVAIVEVQDSENINLLTVKDLDSGYSIAPYKYNHYHNRIRDAYMIEFNGSLYVSYMWIDQGEAQFWRIGFNVDRYNISTGVWTHVVRQDELYSGANASGGVSTWCLGDDNPDYWWGGVMIPVLYDGQIYYLTQFGADTPATSLQSTTWWSNWRVHSISSSHVVTEVTSRSIHYLFPYTTYVSGSGGTQQDYDSYMWVAPRKSKAFLASDGRPAWLYYNWAGRFWGVIRLGVSELGTDYRTVPDPDQLTGGASINHLLPFRTSANRVGIIENSPMESRGHLRVWDYEVGTDMASRYRIIPNGVYSGSFPLRIPVNAPRTLLSNRMLIPDLDYALDGTEPDVSGMQVQLLNDPNNIFASVVTPTNSALYEDGNYYIFNLLSTNTGESELVFRGARLSRFGDRIPIPRPVRGRVSGE